MSRTPTMIAALLLAALAGCGGGDREERELMKPEDTVVGDLVTAPGKVEDRTNAAMDLHRDALEERLRQDEGGTPAEQ